MSFDRARAVADAVLLEGYVLYPYRASSRKNRYRWAFGILAPEAWSEAGGCEAWWMETQFPLEAGTGARLEGMLRFLQLQRRTVARSADGGATFDPVDELDVDGTLLVPWDEGELRELPFAAKVSDLLRGEVWAPFEVPAGTEVEDLHDRTGALVGRVTRTRARVSGTVRMGAEHVGGRDDLLRVRVRVENVTPFADPSAARTEALCAACLSTHVILSARGGAFVSLLDPPDDAREAVAGCQNVRAYPVLAGAEGERDLLLSAPIILYDHPRVAPESPGDFFDATEIDELLTLRTSTLTPDEKRQARATDARAAAIIDRVDHIPPEVMERLHGAIRDLRDASPPSIGPGTRVRLRPGRRRTDAQDILYDGHVATVHEVREDVDGEELLAVTIDDDPAAELHSWYGRFHYYYRDEVEVLEEDPA